MKTIKNFIVWVLMILFLVTLVIGNLVPKTIGNYVWPICVISFIGLIVYGLFVYESPKVRS